MPLNSHSNCTRTFKRRTGPLKCLTKNPPSDLPGERSQIESETYWRIEIKPNTQRSEKMKQAKLESQALLRRALVGNALFSILCALTILAFNHWLVRFLGLPEQVSLIVLAIGLIGYAVMLLYNARRPRIRISDA